MWLDAELHNLYTPPDFVRGIKSRRDEMGAACNTHGKYCEMPTKF